MVTAQRETEATGAPTNFYRVNHKEAKGRVPRTPNLRDNQRKGSLQRVWKMSREKNTGRGLSQVPGTSAQLEAGVLGWVKCCQQGTAEAQKRVKSLRR